MSNSSIPYCPLIFRQLFEADSSTYTYLLADPASGEALLIDPVLETVERDLQVLKDMNLTLKATLETYASITWTGALRLKNQTQCRIAYPAMIDAACIDIRVREGEPLRIGTIELSPLFTPGHTDHHHAYLLDTPIHKMVFTGDALLIEACGRTDFQSGDSATLYNEDYNKIFPLPDETLVYLGTLRTERFDHGRPGKSA
ncbi:MAG: MBL fold metallo-hydrolase [Thiolinea sp.]